MWWWWLVLRVVVVSRVEVVVEVRLAPPPL